MKRVYRAAAGLLALSPVAGYAQSTAPHAQDSTGLAEIVVTAQRRTENLQEVPISVSAFSGDLLQKLNAKAATDYLNQTPNVSYTEDKQSGSRGLTVSMRGVNNLVTGENAFVNSVGIYLDEFSIASVPNGVANPFMPDMERVEVLRGPQGTYFGRNALGGALNLTTREPTDKYEGQVTLGAEKYRSYGNAENITGIFNLPVSDTFRMRGTVFYEDSKGMVENINPGGNGAGHKWLNLRLKGVWAPSAATRISFNVLYGNEDQGADENVPSGVNDLDTIDTFGYQPGTAFDPGTGFWKSQQSKFSADLRQKNKQDSTIAVLNVSHKISEQTTWKTVVGLIDSKNDRFFDNDLIGNLDLLTRTNHYEGKSYSLETRFETHSETTDVVWGAMLAHDKQDQNNNVAVSSNPTAGLTRDGIDYGFLPPFPAGLGLARNTKSFKVDSGALFFDATRHLTSATEVFAGARYTRDDVNKTLQAYGLRPGLNPDPNCAGFFGCFGNFQRTPAAGGAIFDDVTPRIGLRHKITDDVGVYATISRGYKAGGLSTGNSATGAPLAGRFNKETLWNYEAGIKSEFADHRVRLNASVFVMKWSDLQMEAFRFLVPGDLSTNFEQTINIPSATAKGIEIELTAKPMENLTVGGSFGYLDTEITGEPSTTCASGVGTCNGAYITGGYLVQLKGLEIPNSPKTTLSAFGEYRMPLAGNSAWVRAEFQHRASQYSDIEGITNLQTRGPSPNQGLTRVVPADEFPYKVPAFDVFNLRGGYDWDRASVGLYVNNVADEKYYTGTYQKFGLSGMRLRPHPRTIGANVTFRF